MADGPRQSLVLVVDALELRRAGIASLISEWGRATGLSTVAIAPEDILEYSQSAEDVHFIILSIGGSSLHEIELQDCARKVRDLFPGVPVAIISDRKEADEAVIAARMGEQAFLSTGMQPDVARHALTFILGGGTFFPREALLQSASPTRIPSGQSLHSETESGGLTKRQHEVLERLSLGRSNKHIARDLNMQESTVKVHVRQIMRKLGASNRTQAALIASTAKAETREEHPLPHLVGSGNGAVHALDFPSSLLAKEFPVAVHPA